ncbi:Sec-independent protein translocase subunit TatA/TatB [Moraxella oblonga]|uniref:Sec-independent protein translocase subunit TatA/TatB n=1 Tax=Moraxella oblonga TaxID=200413 RepID=UPI00082E262C|nr:twin-arginine translocase TatA/TatE family subunit [Moraxella oblonga]
MFNLGLFELGLFGIIALIILGPEKLIITARTLGKWYGQFRRMSARLQSELVSELELTELQNELQAQIAEIRASEAKMRAQVQELQTKIEQAEHEARTSQNALLSDWQNTQNGDTPTLPMTNQFFLLGDYDKKRRLPPAPFMPNYKADQLLYQTNK